MLKFFILSVLLFVLFSVKKKSESYTVTISFSPEVYDFIKALTVALAVSLLTN